MTNREFSNNDIDLLKTGFDTCRNADILKLYCNRPFHVHKEGGQFAVADCKGREAGDGTWRWGDLEMGGSGDGGTWRWDMEMGHGDEGS